MHGWMFMDKNFLANIPTKHNTLALEQETFS